MAFARSAGEVNRFMMRDSDTADTTASIRSRTATRMGEENDRGRGRGAQLLRSERNGLYPTSRAHGAGREEHRGRPEEARRTGRKHACATTSAGCAEWPRVEVAACC